MEEISNEVQELEEVLNNAATEGQAIMV